MTCPKCQKEIQDDSIFCQYCGRKVINTKSQKRKIKRPNGMGSVVKLTGKRTKSFQARKSINGKRVHLGTFETKTEALLCLEKYNNQDLSNLHEATVEDIYKMLVDQKEEKLTKSGLTNYVSGYKYLEQFKKLKMRNIKTAHFQQAINNAAESGVGLATWKKIQNVGSLMCQIAMANDLINKNYAQLVTFPKAEKKEEKPSFSPEQLKKMWSLWENDYTITAILALCYNGLRINEFLDLKKEHIDLDQRVIFAPGSKTRAGKNRIIAIPEDVIPIYQKLMSTQGPYLFPSPKGGRWDAKNFRDRYFYKALEEHGLNICEDNPSAKITPHSCRHTYAALCVTNDLNEKATMDLMGHSKYSTTVQLYANATAKNIDFLRSEADKIHK